MPNCVYSSGLKATDLFVMLLIQDGFKNGFPERKFQKITSKSVLVLSCGHYEIFYRTSSVDAFVSFINCFVWASANLLFLIKNNVRWFLLKSFADLVRASKLVWFYLHFKHLIKQDLSVPGKTNSFVSKACFFCCGCCFLFALLFFFFRALNIYTIKITTKNPET